MKKKRTIALRIEQEIWDRFDIEAKKMCQPITGWILVTAIERLPKETKTTTTPDKETPVLPLTEQILAIMEGGQWFLKGDIIGQLGSIAKYELNLALSELIRAGKIKEDAGAEIYRIRRVI